ncbi:ATP-binding protein [Ekhidna sp.]|uniref:ATP-binding protein n=1 Tax=Ekhidna sp. TaxID=2608089 RepID=UPI003BA84259
MNTQIKPTILCLFSGGIDSTGVLHQLITHKKYKDANLIVHHIHIHNRENRAKAEAKAVKSIIECYKKNYDRQFLVTESVFDSRGFSSLRSKRYPYDMDVCAFYAANIAVGRKNIRFVAWGRTKTDVSSGGSFEARMKRMQDVFDSVWLLEKEPIPKFIFPLIKYTKAEIWNSIPPEVQSNVWWCRTPIYQEDKILPCGVCGTCTQTKAFIDG